MNTKLEGYSRFQETELYPVGIGAEPQQAENSHFHNDGNGSFRAYVKHMHCLLLLYQTLITWMISALALESDSMRSRSSLLRGRTAFSIYRFDNRDRAFVIGLFACITLTVMGVILGASKMWYNPRIIWRPLNGIGIVTAIGYLALCFMPLGLELWTEYLFSVARKTA